jgi:hypothetical protein
VAPRSCDFLPQLKGTVEHESCPKLDRTLEIIWSIRGLERLQDGRQHVKSNRPMSKATISRALSIVGENQQLVPCLLGESPSEGDGAVERGLAALP